MGIIGIVAALTMPALIANHQKMQMLSQLKKTYSVIANAISMSVSENGDVETWVLDSANDINAASDFAEKYLIPYLQVVKNCGINTSGECSYSLTAMNGTDVTNRVKNFSRFFLNDGTMVFVSTKVDSATATFPMIVSISVDINGHKKPNKSGRDYFEFAVALDTTDDMYRPVGRLNASGQSHSREEIISPALASCERSSYGYYCAALIMKDGWQITDDYPW